MNCTYCRTELTAEALEKERCHKCGAPFRPDSVETYSFSKSIGGNALTRYEVDNMFLLLYERGGNCSRIVTDVWGLRKITDFYEGFVMIDKLGEKLVKRLMHPITGESVIIVPSRDLHGEMYFVGNETVKLAGYSTTC